MAPLRSVAQHHPVPPPYPLITQQDHPRPRQEVHIARRRPGHGRSVDPCPRAGLSRSWRLLRLPLWNRRRRDHGGRRLQPRPVRGRRHRSQQVHRQRRRPTGPSSEVSHFCLTAQPWWLTCRSGGFGGSRRDFVTSGTFFYANCAQPDGTYVAAGGIDLSKQILRSSILESSGQS